jgi:ESS family glutamate:Na+ symporter
MTTSARWWTWLVTIEPEWKFAPAKSANLPFLVAFFTCIGLGASWTLVRSATRPILLLLLLAAVTAVMQNIVGVALARAMGSPVLLGLVCGSVTLTGGHGTALGFAPDLAKAGLHGAAAAGAAAATFGLVTGALLSGPLGRELIRRRCLRSNPTAATSIVDQGGRSRARGFLSETFALARNSRAALVHLSLVLGCVKLGAWVSHFLQSLGATFPVALGAMLVGVAARNVLDAAGVRWFRPELVERIASVTLAIFLTLAMMSMNLLDLAHTAGPMFVILAVQVVMMAAFAWWITFPGMGRDYDAAVMAAGHCGFGLGSTATAVASMKAITESAGPSPRAFLVVPVVGSFLVDLVNALTIAGFINLVK